MRLEPPTDAPPFADLRDKALILRRSVNGSRARLYRQRETLRRLHADLAALRQMAAATSRPSGAARRHSTLVKLLPCAALAVFALSPQFPAGRQDALPPIASLRACAPKPAIDDDRGNEAVSLVHEWRAAGDDRPLIERVKQASQPPGARPAWDVERTGRATYRVTFRPEDPDPLLEFEVDLDTRRVDPAPDTALFLTPNLTARR